MLIVDYHYQSWMLGQASPPADVSLIDPNC